MIFGTDDTRAREWPGRHLDTALPVPTLGEVGSFDSRRNENENASLHDNDFSHSTCRSSGL